MIGIIIITVLPRHFLIEKIHNDEEETPHIISP
jgi:hypothetical protein